MYIANLFAFVLYPNCSLFLAVRSGDAHRLAAGDAYAGAQGDGRRDLAAEGRAAQQEQDARAAGVAAEGADGLRRPQTPVRVSEIFEGPSIYDVHSSHSRSADEGVLRTEREGVERVKLRTDVLCGCPLKQSVIPLLPSPPFQASQCSPNNSPIISHCGIGCKFRGGARHPALSVSWRREGFCSFQSPVAEERAVPISQKIRL